MMDAVNIIQAKRLLPGLVLRSLMATHKAGYSIDNTLNPINE
ncbi:MAG: hypothetical protein OEY93_09125 [Anaerolineae bacterium]|nr:hypothetical protein [Anaerolineae bacterium]